MIFAISLIIEVITERVLNLNVQLGNTIRFCDLCARFALLVPTSIFKALENCELWTVYVQCCYL